MQEWTGNEKDEAYKRLKSRGFLSRAISVPIIELQCEVTALREALESMVYRGDMQATMGKIAPDESEVRNLAKALLARIPQ